MKKYSIWFLLLALYGLPGYASNFILPANGNMVGEINTVDARSGETLTDVGRRFDIGHNEIINANPRISPLRQLFGGTKVLIPNQFILPDGPRQGIVINLAEFRLYYYPPGENIVVTEPVGIGREGWNTPIGTTHVTSKQVDPIWRPTPNVRAEAAKNGTPIPSYFPAGINNPLGKYILRLGWPTYLIHGTNRPEGVGARVSAGCIRMLPDDVEYLYKSVKIGTKVRVINEPIKIGWLDKKMYIESHPTLKDKHKKSFDKQWLENIISQPDGTSINWKNVKNVITNANGLPELVS
jgi:L,D-transpeptidase ErfK/SrfK